MLNEDKLYEVEYEIRFAQENDTREIIEFIKSIKYRKDYWQIIEDYKVSYIPNKKHYFDEIEIRQRLYNCKDTYVMLLQNGIIIGLICFSIPDILVSTVLELKYIIIRNTQQNMVNEMFEYALTKLDKHTIISTTKIRVMISSNTSNFDYSKKLLFDIGFDIESDKNDEIELGVNLVSMILKTKGHELRMGEEQ